MTRIPIESIRIEGKRRPLGDVTALIASIEEVGLLNPITVRRDGKGYILVAGLHRLEAAKQMDWLEIEAVVVDLEPLEAELAEIDENLVRNDLTTLERGEQLARRKAIYEELHPEARERSSKRQRARRLGEPAETVSAFTTEAAEKAGITDRSVRQHVQIATAIPDDVRDVIRETPVADSTTQLLTLARQAPEVQREVAGRIASGQARDVSAALTGMRREERIDRMPEAAPTLPAGRRYPVIYADPPWRYDFSRDSADDIEEHYPTMTVEEICALDVPATENAVLFLWATAPKLREALRALEAWGFEYRTHAIWDKEWPGMGYWFRGRHELLLVGVRGDVPPPVPSARFDSVLRHRREAHSQKPHTVREWIEAMFPTLPRIELFARERAENWDAWGNQA